MPQPERGPDTGRLAGGCAIAGALVTGAAYGLHPDDAVSGPEYVALLAASAVWTPVHFGLGVGLVLVYAAVALVTASLRATPGERWGRLAFALSGVATTLWLGLVALEITLGRAAPRAGDASALLLLRGLVETLISTAIVVNWLSTALLGAGLGASGRYPGWLSGSGVALGVLIVLAVGVPRAALGPTPLVDAALFPGLATLSLVWLVALGLRLWRG